MSLRSPLGTVLGSGSAKEGVHHWWVQRLTALALILFIFVATWHSQLGVRVIVEDYVHANGVRTVTLIVLTCAHVLLAAAGVFAVLTVAFVGAR